MSATLKYIAYLCDNPYDLAKPRMEVGGGML